MKGRILAAAAVAIGVASFTPRPVLRARDAAPVHRVAERDALVAVSAETRRVVERASVSYTARVDGDGFVFAAGGAALILRTVVARQGAAEVACDSGTVRERGARASIDRGSFVEEYVFEDERVEQLY